VAWGRDPFDRVVTTPLSPGEREQQPGDKCEPQDQRDEPVAEAATRLAGVDLFKRRL
jgi:hypothetical protein